MPALGREWLSRGIGVVIFAEFLRGAILSACCRACSRRCGSQRFHSTHREAQERDRRGVALVPLLLLSGYWALMSVGSTPDDRAQVLLGYSLIFVAVAWVFQSDPGAVRETLILVSLFVAVLGYAWLLTTATYTILGFDPGSPVWAEPTAGRTSVT